MSFGCYTAAIPSALAVGPGLGSFIRMGTAPVGIDVVIVHEWNPPELVASLGRKRIGGGRFKLFFHDTHHRSASDPGAMSVYDLEGYDGVLAFGEAVRQNYLKRGWSRR